MVSQVDPSTLGLKWSLRGDFELHVHVPAPDGQSGTVDHLGTVKQMGPMTPLSPGTDKNKVVDLVMSVRTSTQAADAAPLWPATDAGGLLGPELGPQDCVLEDGSGQTKHL